MSYWCCVLQLDTLPIEVQRTKFDQQEADEARGGLMETSIELRD